LAVNFGKENRSLIAIMLCVFPKLANSRLVSHDKRNERVHRGC